MSTEPAALSLALTEEDVRRLLEDKTPDTRVDLTDKIATAYGNQQLTPEETQAVEQIFRLLLRDTELRVRVSLAQHLKTNAQVPRDIVMAMARDVEEVSLPVLQYSEVLNDQDLIELIRNTDEISRYLAISRRPKVSGVVSDTLLEKGDEKVIATLVENTGAELSEEGIEKIIETQGENETIMQAMSSRPRLPIAAVEKLVHVVSASLAHSLKQKYQIAAGEVDKETEKTRESETLGLIRLSHSQGDIEKLVRQLQAYGRLTPSIILSALCQGNFAFFETSLALLSAIPVHNARKLITDKGDLGFRAIYNKSGLPETMFPAVKLLLKVVHELDDAGEKQGSSRYANRIVERILQYSEGEQIENLSYIIALVRRIAQ